MNQLNKSEGDFTVLPSFGLFFEFLQSWKMDESVRYRGTKSLKSSRAGCQDRGLQVILLLNHDPDVD